MNWHNEIIKREQDELAPIFKTDNMATRHQQLRDMMEDLGYGGDKFYPKLTEILDRATIGSVKQRLKPSVDIPGYYNLPLWIYEKMSLERKKNNAYILQLEAEISDLKEKMKINTK